MVTLLFITFIAVLFSLHLPGQLDPCGRPPLPPGHVPAPVRGPCDDATIIVVGSPLTITKAFSTFVTAFKCQQNLFSVTNELERPTSSRVGRRLASAHLGPPRPTSAYLV